MAAALPCWRPSTQSPPPEGEVPELNPLAPLPRPLLCPRSWLNAPDAASWDLILIHYGDGPGQYCPECKEVYQAKGPKWRLVHELFKSPDWEGLRQHYRAVMLADADLLLDTCTINRAFEVFHEYNLLMAQPSLCDKSWVYSYWRILFQQPQNVLRFVTFNEIMASVLSLR